MVLAARIRAFLGDDTGATAIEYGLIAALVAVAVIGSFAVLGNEINGLFNNGTAELLSEQTAKIP